MKPQFKKFMQLRKFSRFSLNQNPCEIYIMKLKENFEINYLLEHVIKKMSLSMKALSIVLSPAAYPFMQKLRRSFPLIVQRIHSIFGEDIYILFKWSFEKHRTWETWRCGTPEKPNENVYNQKSCKELQLVGDLQETRTNKRNKCSQQTNL